jgi:hypothetical protein
LSATVKPAQDTAANRLAAVVRAIATEKHAELDQLKANQHDIARPDFVWHYLLQSFSTMGRSAGWKGLIGTAANYTRVTYDALAQLTPAQRRIQVEETCRAAKVRMPGIKAKFILGCFDRVQQLGGPQEAKAVLFGQRGRDAKIKFLKSFPGIGPKYARNIMMDVYHPEFHDSIAIDIRIQAISDKLGVSFPTYAEHEAFYLEVARRACVNGWELDRLLYNFRQEIEAGLDRRP